MNHETSEKNRKKLFELVVEELFSGDYDSLINSMERRLYERYNPKLFSILQDDIVLVKQLRSEAT